MYKQLLEVLTTACVAAVGFGCGEQSDASEGEGDNEVSLVADAQSFRVHKQSKAVIRDAAGKKLGFAAFIGSSSGHTQVAVSLRLPTSEHGIHGFHVHANDNPANGEGCVADPTQPANTHFVSADGHYNPEGAIHGDHAGDMPALFVGADGVAAMAFLIDYFTPREVRGRAVIVHALPDNYANVPVGSAPNQYTPNSAEATTLTNNTGNAGNRIGCGIIR